MQSDLGALHVRAALAMGRHGEALAIVSRLRRARRASFAVEESEACLGLMRPVAALKTVVRALRRPTTDASRRTRLLLVQARALGQTGATRRAVAVASEAAVTATDELTSAQAKETLAQLAWRELRGDDACRLAREALRVYETAQAPEGVARVLEIEAAALRDAGRFEDALKLMDRRVTAASATTRVDELARAHADRGDLLAFVGRFDEAARALDTAIDLFHRLGDEREHTLARPRRAMVDLARGNLAAVARCLEDARGCAFDAPRLRGEHHLLGSDLKLAGGDPTLAVSEAQAALQAFASARAREGVCRARIRLALALLAAERVSEARREAARAVRCAPEERRDLGLLARLALGRAELRLSAERAERAFREALALGDTRRGPAVAARLGVLLASGRGSADPEVAGLVVELERWGDRRFLSYALADLRRLDRAGAASSIDSSAAAEPAVERRGCGTAQALASAGECLLGAGPWVERLAEALRAVRPVVGWHRAAWLSRTGAFEVGERGSAVVLAADDLARAAAMAISGTRSLDLSSGPFARHPSCVLHGVSAAWVVGAPQESRLYVDFRQEPPPGVLAALLPLARLLVAAEDACNTLGTSETPSHPLPKLLGECEAMRSVRQAIQRVGRSGLAVHLFGETGTGKERVAEALHEASARRGRLVSVNAAQLEESLFEATMFGHVKGSFTSALADAEGLVAVANGGTLFLDEAIELSQRVQAKLLRFLETGEYTRVGDPRPRQADVRVVSAANVSLRQRVREGRFREDLMYRLVDYTIELPPLRERGDDILLLARHFLRLYATAEGRPCPRLSPDALRALLAHAWPGNVRELMKQMHSAVVLAPSGVVSAAELSFERAAPLAGEPTLREARAALERDLVTRYLGEHAGCRARAAEALGITRQALAVKLRQLGL